MSKLTDIKKNKATNLSTNDLLATTNILGALGSSDPITTTVLTTSNENTATSATTGSDAPLAGAKAGAGQQSTAVSTLAAVTLPTPPKPDLTASSDTGSSSSDNITRDTTPTLSGTATARATVTIKDGAIVLGTAVASSSGKWTFTTGVLGQGTHSFTATAKDKAGNTSAASQPLEVTIDTTSPAAPSGLDLAASDDTGAADSDNVTNRKSGLTLSGSGEAGATVTVYDDTNNNGTRNSGEATLATATINAAGVFTVDIALSTGVHNVRAFQTDLAGNAGGSSAALKVTVDTTAPAAPAGLNLATEDDTGTSSSDNITSLAFGLTVSGSGVNGSTVTLYDDANNDGVRNGSEAPLGTASVSAGAFGLDIALSAGLHHVRAVQSDLAGNVSASSSALDITVESPPPLAWITLASITADNIVKSSDLALSTVPVTGIVGGEADPGDTVTVTVNDFDYMVQVAADGSFSIDVAGSELLADADARVEASVTTTIDGNPVTVTDVQSYWRDPGEVFGGVSYFTPVNNQSLVLGGLEYWVQNGNYDWSIASQDPQALRFELHSGDRWQYDSSSTERTEIAGHQLYAPSETLTLNYEFTLEEGDPNSADWIVLGQFHADDQTTSPPYAMELKDERMAIMVRYLDNNKYVSQYVYVDPNDIDRGHAYDMTVSARFSNNSSGFLKVWRDDVQIVDYSGPIGYGYDVYWKMGVYRSEADETLAANYTGFFITDGALVA